MSWLDNVVAWISPEAGAKRAAWRATYNELRNYDAGNNSRLNAGWRAANYSAEMTDRTSRDTIRARARPGKKLRHREFTDISIQAKRHRRRI